MFILLMKSFRSYLHLQRLKAAVHYGVGQICEEISQDENINLSKQFIAVLSEAAFKHCTTMAHDLELFAK